MSISNSYIYKCLIIGMARGKIHIGDKNTEIILTVYETLSNGSNVVFNFQTYPASSLQILVTDPDGVSKTPLTAALKSPPGTDGKISGTNSDETYFDQAGAWTFQAKITLVSGGIYTSNPHIEEVLG